MQDWVNSPSVRNPAWEGKCTCLRDPQLEPPGRAELWAAGSREGFARRPGLGGRKWGKEGGTGLREAPCPGGDVPLPSPAHLTRCKVAFAIKTQVPQGLPSTLLCAEPAQARRRQEAARGRGRGRGGPGREGAARPPGATSLGRRGARTPCSRARCSPSAKWGVLAEIGPCPLAYREPPALVLS